MKKKRPEPDFLDEMIAEGELRSPGFSGLVDEAYERRLLARDLSARRKQRGLSQTQVAARMNTAASVVSKLENGGDFKFSTLQKYLEVLGLDLTYDLESGRGSARRSGER